MAHQAPSVDTSRDPLARMRVYQIARDLVPDCWKDAQKLRHHPVTEKLAGQLYAAVTSIASNISEGYSRSSGKDRAKIFEYALGFVRESMDWYRSCEPALGATTTKDRLDRLEEMRRMLLAIIPRERGRLIRKSD